MKTTWFHALCFSVVFLGGSLAAGESAAPPLPPPIPNTPPAPNPPAPPKPGVPIGGVPAKSPGPNPNAELSPMLVDLQNGTPEKRDAAVKSLVARGGSAYRAMNLFVTSADADLVKRAKSVREQIEKRGQQMIQDANTLQGKALSGPWTSASLDEVRNTWMTVAAYVAQPELRQNAIQTMQAIQSMMGQIEQANKDIAAKDAELNATPPPIPIARAAIQIARAQAFTLVHRFDDALKAAQDAYEAGGRDCRHAPEALKVQAEMAAQKGDSETIEKLCKKLIADYGESLEARYAYATLTDLLVEHKRWDDAVEASKKFIGACPLEEDAQDAADKLLDALMLARDYPRAYGLSTWIKQRLPASRVKPDVLKTLAGCSEFALRDLAKAEIAYKTLATDYADVMDAKEAAAALKRIKAKIDGTFPKEPKVGDEGPAGALAQFLAAVRTRDAKKIAEAVPAAEAIEAAGKLTCEECELIQTVTFGDFIVKKADIDGDKAELEIDYYDAASSAPKSIQQKALKEKGAWKIQWTEPDEQLNPPSKTPKVSAKPK